MTGAEGVEMNLSVVVSSAGEAGNIGVLRLSGELDIATSGTLRQSLDALRDEGQENLVLDLSGVTFCDSTGLGTIVWLHRQLAERGGAVVGFALVGYAGWTPEFSCVLPHRYARLEDLAVDEAVRGQGVGGELLAAAKRWARNRRLEYLELNVLAQNENAIRLYESQDFVEATKVMRCML